MRLLRNILAMILTLGIALCGDAIINIAVEGKNTFWQVGTYIGRISIGYFYFPEVYKFIKRKLKW